VATGATLFQSVARLKIPDRDFQAFSRAFYLINKQKYYLFIFYIL